MLSDMLLSCISWCFHSTATLFSASWRTYRRGEREKEHRFTAFPKSSIHFCELSHLSVINSAKVWCMQSTIWLVRLKFLLEVISAVVLWKRDWFLTTVYLLWSSRAGLRVKWKWVTAPENTKKKQHWFETQLQPNPSSDTIVVYSMWRPTIKVPLNLREY